MSAWVVSKAHIDYLVTLAQVLQVTAKGLGYEERDKLGALLWEENHRSVNYRYNEEEPTPPYTYEAHPRLRDGERALRTEVGQALKAIACYAYQSCERPDWEESAAYLFCNELRDQLSRFVPGYNEAEWGL